MPSFFYRCHVPPEINRCFACRKVPVNFNTALKVQVSALGRLSLFPPGTIINYGTRLALFLPTLCANLMPYVYL